MAQHCVQKYMWDDLPLRNGPAEGSILRLDAVQAVSQHQYAFALTEHRLNGDALEILNGWIDGYLTGEIDEGCDFEVARTLLHENSS